MKKKLALVLAGIGFASAPLVAFCGTGDLTIFNNTPYDSTCQIEGHCTSEGLPYGLGADGITTPGQHHVIASGKVKLACRTMTKDCTALVFNNDTCTGAPIASVTFNVVSGYNGTYTSYDPSYKIVGSGFNLEIDKVS